MSNLFKPKPKAKSVEKVEDKIEEPATMPDEEDVVVKRKRRRPATRTSGRNSTRRVKTEASTGREYSRGTLG